MHASAGVFVGSKINHVELFPPPPSARSGTNRATPGLRSQRQVLTPLAPTSVAAALPWVLLCCDNGEVMVWDVSDSWTAPPTTMGRSGTAVGSGAMVGDEESGLSPATAQGMQAVQRCVLLGHKR